MTRLTRLAPAVAALALAISMPLAAAGFETPEDAVREYLAGVAVGDVERILNASAVDEVVDGYRFDQQVERVRAFVPVSPGPVHSPFFREVQRADWTGRLLWRTRMLVYSLLAPDVLGEALEGATLTDVDAAWAADLVTALDAARLSNLVVADVAVPARELQNDDSYLEHSARSAGIYGADEQTERVALLDFEGDTYIVGFTLMRYGDAWKIAQQSSAIAGTPVLGTAMPMSFEEFTEFTSE